MDTLTSISAGGVPARAARPIADLARGQGFADVPDHELSQPELLELAASIAARPELWRERVAFDDDQRHYVCLYRDAVVDVWLLCWTPSNDTGWHDHDVSSGSVAVVSGRLVEHALAIGAGGVPTEVAAGHVFSFGPDHIHRLTGHAPESVSVHAYSPPLWRMGQYTVDTVGVLHRLSVSYADELRPLDPDTAVGTTTVTDPGSPGMTTADPSAPLDLIVVGGGVMGLFTAYHASGEGRRVVVLERGTVGDPMTASFGRTRSYRRDYLDVDYVRLADVAMTLWTEFEQATGTAVLVRCGCMNIATEAVTPELDKTYAALSTAVMVDLDLAPEIVDPADIATRFPYLTADLAHLDPEAGLVDLRTVTATLTRVLAEREVPVLELVEVTAIDDAGDDVVVTSSAGTFHAGSVVVTAGHGTNDVLALLAGDTLHVPLSRDRPSEAKYFDPPSDQRHLFTSDVMPVIAYLDTGVYVHPIVDGVVEHVKVGYYNPPDIPRDRTGVNDIADFVAQCMPGLASATFDDVTDTDGCDYDLVADDDFVMGAVPGHPRVFVGVGWRGTGYKYSPWVGRTMAELASHGRTTDDIGRFTPSRFARQEATR